MQINRETVDANAQWERRITEVAQIRNDIAALKNKLYDMETQLRDREVWLAHNTKEDPLPLPPKPDVSELDAIISNAAADEVRYEQYKKNLARATEAKAKAVELSKHEIRVAEIRQQKISKLAGISATCGVPGLAFDDAGNFIYEGTTAGMLSTSQLMRLSSAVAGLYPEGFGLDLLDRGESLGRHIFEYVDRAREKNTTILATVVGERPAKVPSGCGVFVVQDGVVIKDEEAAS